MPQASTYLTLIAQASVLLRVVLWAGASISALLSCLVKSGVFGCPPTYSPPLLFSAFPASVTGFFSCVCAMSASLVMHAKIFYPVTDFVSCSASICKNVAAVCLIACNAIVSFDRAPKALLGLFCGWGALFSHLRPCAYRKHTDTARYECPKAVDDMKALETGL